MAEQAQEEAERKLVKLNRIQREAARVLELAITELEAWETSFDMFKKRYDKLKCDETETVRGNIAGQSYDSQTDNQTLSQMSLVKPAITTTMKSMSFIDEATQICDPVIIAGPSRVKTSLAKASTSGKLYNHAIKTTNFPGQSLSFGLNLTI